jgi:phosphate ABC transporter permease subunit PstA
MTTTLPPGPTEQRPAAQKQFPGPERRLRVRSVTPEHLYSIAGAAAGAVGLTWVLYERVLPASGALGFWLCCYVLFLVLYCSVAAMQWGRRFVTDQLASVAVASAGLFAVAVILDQVGYVIFRGWRALVHPNFFTQTMLEAGPLQPLSVGGVLHAMVGSLEQLGIATLFSVPLGVLAALFLAEVGGPLARPVRVIVEAMTALPEIIAGLFIYAVVIITLGTHQDGFAAGLALTVMMVPIVTRTAEVMIRLVPNNLREAAYALGASQWRTTWNVVLPTARSGLTTASVLAMARAVGETAPVLLTAGAANGLNINPFQGPQISLPLYIWNFVKFPQHTMVDRAFGAALALMIMVLILFTAARVLGGKRPGELTRRQRRRLARDSRLGEASSRHRAPVAAGPQPGVLP